MAEKGSRVPQFASGVGNAAADLSLAFEEITFIRHSNLPPRQNAGTFGPEQMSGLMQPKRRIAGIVQNV